VRNLWDETVLAQAAPSLRTTKATGWRIFKPRLSSARGPDLEQIANLTTGLTSCPLVLAAKFRRNRRGGLTASFLPRRCWTGWWRAVSLCACRFAAPQNAASASAVARRKTLDAFACGLPRGALADARKT